MAQVVTPEQMERKSLFERMVGLLKGIFETSKKDRDESAKRGEQQHNVIVDSLKGIFSSAKQQGTELIQSTKSNISQLFDVRGILESQLGPLTPIVESIGGHLKNFSKKFFGGFGSFLKQFFWNSLREKGFRKWMKEEVWGTLRKSFKGIAGLLLFLPFMIGAFLKEGPLRIAKFILSPLLKVIRNLRTIDWFKKFPRIASFINLFREGGKFAKIGGFLGRIGGIFGKIAISPIKKVFGFFRWIAGLKLPFLGLATGIGKVLGRLFIPLQIILSVYDFFKGFRLAGDEATLKEKIIGGISSVISGFIKPIGQLFDWILGKFGVNSNIAKYLNIETISGVLTSAVDWVVLGVNKLLEFGKIIVDFWLTVNEKIVGAINWVLGFIPGLDLKLPTAREMIAGLSDFGETIVNSIKNIFKKETWQEAFMTAKGMIVESISGAVSTIGDFFSGLFRLDTIKEMLRPLVPDFLLKVGPVKKFFETTEVAESASPIRKAIPSAREGAFVTETGVIKVHEGEVVSPIEKIIPLISKPVAAAQSGMLAQKVVEATNELKESITKVIEERPAERVLPPPPTDITLGNIPLIIEDTGLILVSSGVL